MFYVLISIKNIVFSFIGRALDLGMVNVGIGYLEIKVLGWGVGGGEVGQHNLVATLVLMVSI